MVTNEREYLRELAKKQLEYAMLPTTQQKIKRWYDHNRLKGEQPMVVMEVQSFWGEILPEMKCSDPKMREIERKLQQSITAHELIDDDRVIPDFFPVEVVINRKMWQQEVGRTYADDGLGYHIDPILEDLEEDLEKLKPTINSYDAEKTSLNIALAEETLGDILPIKKVNTLNYWEFGITQLVVNLMGMENMFISMMTTPDEFHTLMQFVVDDLVRLLRFEEENDILFLNNGNDYMGSGSFCFNDELVGDGGRVKSVHTFGHLNSQETVGVSPEMYKEFIYPYYLELSKQFGLLYYGCCEPVHDFFDDCVENYHNLRKVSISPWCDEDIMSRKLAGRDIIYSRKPSPNFIGIEKELDESAFRDYIAKTARLTKDCKKEVLFRDIYRLNGNRDKLNRAVQIVREEFLR